MLLPWQDTNEIKSSGAWMGAGRIPSQGKGKVQSTLHRRLRWKSKRTPSLCNRKRDALCWQRTRAIWCLRLHVVCHPVSDQSHVTMLGMPVLIDAFGVCRWCSCRW